MAKPVIKLSGAMSSAGKKPETNSVARAPIAKTKPKTVIPEETLMEFIPEGYSFDKVLTKALKDSEWNDKFFSKVEEDRLLDLMASIQETGLQQPIVVRAVGNQEYEILAGHTRRRAYEKLYEETRQEKYQSIEAFIYEEGVISDEKAKEIIIDTNLFNRGGLPVGDMARCIAYKCEQIKKNSTYGAGSVNQQLAEKLNTSSSFIKDMRAIARLNNELIDLIVKEQLTQKSAVKLSVLSKEDQDILCNGYLDRIDNVIVSRAASPLAGGAITAEKIISTINKADEKNEYVSVTKKCLKSQYDKDKHKAVMVIVDKKDKKRLTALKRLLADNGFDNIIQ